MTTPKLQPHRKPPLVHLRYDDAALCLGDAEAARDEAAYIHSRALEGFGSEASNPAPAAKRLDRKERAVKAILSAPAVDIANKVPQATCPKCLRVLDANPQLRNVAATNGRRPPLQIVEQLTLAVVK